MIFQDTVDVYLRCFTKLFTCLYYIHNETKTLMMNETESAGSFNLYSFIFGFHFGHFWAPVCLYVMSFIRQVTAGDYLLSRVTPIHPCCQAWLRGPLTNPISLRTTGA